MEKTYDALDVLLGGGSGERLNLGDPVVVRHEREVEAELLVDALVDAVPGDGARVHDVDEGGVLALRDDQIQPHVGDGVYGEPRDGL